MAKRIASILTFTPTAIADGIPAAQTFLCIGGGAIPDLILISDILQSGQASSSAFNTMVLTRASTNSVTPTALALPNSDGLSRAGSAPTGALPVVFWDAATRPNRSPPVTIPRLQLGFNAFGGTFRLGLAPGNEWGNLGIAGTTGVVNQSESIFSCQLVGAIASGLQSLSVTYEQA